MRDHEPIEAQARMHGWFVGASLNSILDIVFNGTAPGGANVESVRSRRGGGGDGPTDTAGRARAWPPRSARSSLSYRRPTYRAVRHLHATLTSSSPTIARCC